MHAHPVVSICIAAVCLLVSAVSAEVVMSASDEAEPFRLTADARAQWDAQEHATIKYLQASQPASGADHEDLAKQLQNPVASLISVPLQYNVDFNGGPDDDGTRHVLNVQPVVPLTLNEDWNVIVRTIVPIIYQDGIVDDGGSSQFGLGDTTQSFFFSPKAPGPGGLIWGVGPAFLWPTATNDSLGGEQWGAGPTGLLLWQKGPWTYGALANHIWSYAGDDDRSDVSSTFLQPFFSHTNAKAFTLGINMETTYDWINEEWTVPINIFASQLVKIDKQPISFTLGARYYADAPPGGPEWGLRFVVTLLFPK
ncbi:MAG: hypothetical protein WBD40_13665 [Tepidisphaeraceae bacterium]